MLPTNAGDAVVLRRRWSQREYGPEVCEGSFAADARFVRQAERRAALADTLKELVGQRLTDEDGRTTVLELLPPATDAEIRALEATLPGSLPDEVRAALR